MEDEPRAGLPTSHADSVPATRGKNVLKRDEIGMNRHRAVGCGVSMIFSENRCALFRIML